MTLQVINYSEGDWCALIVDGVCVYENHSISLQNVKDQVGGNEFKLLDDIDFDGSEDEWYEFIAKYSPKTESTLESNNALVYDMPVKFTSTDNYGCDPEDEDDVYTVYEFIRNVEDGGFTDYDGYGYPVKNSMACRNFIVSPSKVDMIPSDATHIVWYNR